MSIVYLIISIILLIFGGDLLVKSSVGLSFKLNISKVVIGMTVVSFATSSPELIVSLLSAHQGHSDIALGNVIGSNIANITLVLGITAIISPIVVERIFYKVNWPMLMAISLLFYLFAYTGRVLTRIEGFLLLLSIVIFLIYLIRNARKVGVQSEEIDEGLETVSNVKIGVWLLLGGFFLWLGSELLISSAIKLATSLGVTERLISVSVVAIGTSIPELAASIIASLKKENALSIGNLIGSNIFNIGFVLGITAMIQPIHVLNQKLLSQDMIWMLFASFILLPIILLPKKYIITRIKGLLIVFVYIGYMYSIF